MNNIEKQLGKCINKQEEEKVQYETNRLYEQGLIETKRRITMCDVCSGYNIHCGEYHPEENRK